MSYDYPWNLLILVVLRVFWSGGGGETWQFNWHEKIPVVSYVEGQDPSPGSMLLLRPWGHKLSLQFLPHALIHVKLFLSVCRQAQLYSSTEGH